MSTDDNLKEAFAGESQANRKYLAFARRADQEGRPQIARLFRAAAAAETIHAHAHFDVMGGVRSTKDNLQHAIAGEGFEFEQMYPRFVAQAEQESNPAAAQSFANAMAVERIHHALYTEALEALRAGGDLPGAPMYVCPVCGNTVAGKPPATCPICATPRDRFIHVE